MTKYIHDTFEIKTFLDDFYNGSLNETEVHLNMYDPMVRVVFQQKCEDRGLTTIGPLPGSGFAGYRIVK